ncbi:hypothetical protein HNR37_002263 [Desulfurispira natronophila]|uniref:Uncharacterized protein n=1 Tax=Desulfurispira natronophila TaxID=682562 RepID=A0A7W7Y6L5_9BACT|nr:hypothetical protein [Desulfurispira natronophila]
MTFLHRLIIPSFANLKDLAWLVTTFGVTRAIISYVMGRIAELFKWYRVAAKIYDWGISLIDANTSSGMPFKQRQMLQFLANRAGYMAHKTDAKDPLFLCQIVPNTVFTGNETGKPAGQVAIELLTSDCVSMGWFYPQRSTSP